MKNLLLHLIFIWVSPTLFAQWIFIPMDESQTEHLQSYAVVSELLLEGQEVEWLLNYQGGSFLIPFKTSVLELCREKGVSIKGMDGKEVDGLRKEMDASAGFQASVPLKNYPKIGIISDPSGPTNLKNSSLGIARNSNDNYPFAGLSEEEPRCMIGSLLFQLGIEFEMISYGDIHDEKLNELDILFADHVDFTGQFSKMYASYGKVQWFKEQKLDADVEAKVYGYEKAGDYIRASVPKILEFIQGGGKFIAMCQSGETFDLAIASEGLDIYPEFLDNSPADVVFGEKVNDKHTIAFQNITLEKNPYRYEFANIDANAGRRVSKEDDFFYLHEFSATDHPFKAQATQNHLRVIPGFMGATTAFKEDKVKSEVNILAQNQDLQEVKILMGTYGSGTFTFIGGHDPEDYRHFVGEKHTRVEDYPNSGGYRLILNHIFATGSQTISLDQHLNLLPNSVDDRTEISFVHEVEGEWEMRIINLQGQLMEQETIYKSGELFIEELNLQDLPSGHYFLTLSQAPYEASIRFVKN